MPPRYWSPSYKPRKKVWHHRDGVALTVRAHGLRFQCPTRLERTKQTASPALAARSILPGVRLWCGECAHVHPPARAYLVVRAEPLTCAATVPLVCIPAVCPACEYGDHSTRLCTYQLCARSVAERGWQALRAGLLGLCSTTGMLAMGSRWPCATRLGSPLSTQGSHCWARHASLPSVFQFQHSLLNLLERRPRVGPRSHRGGARGACGPGRSVTTCVPCVWEHTWRFYGRVAGEASWPLGCLTPMGGTLRGRMQPRRSWALPGPENISLHDWLLTW